MSTAALSARLTELGQPIQDTGITKIEKGDRRVDVDDLVALAVALGVTPNALLMPDLDDPSAAAATVALTPKEQGRADSLWAWAAGEQPWGESPAAAADDETRRLREFLFLRENRPHRIVSPYAYLNQVRRDADGPPAVTVAVGVVYAFRKGLTTGEVRDLAEAAISTALTRPLDEIFPNIKPDEHFPYFRGERPPDAEAEDASR
jgi:transcriptional regulator with XRE-family HTH domain